MTVSSFPFTGAKLFATATCFKKEGCCAQKRRILRIVSYVQEAKKFEQAGLYFEQDPYLTNQKLVHKVRPSRNKIRILSVRNCLQITPQGIYESARQCPLLRSLIFHYHQSAVPSSKWLEKIHSKLPSLCYISIHSWSLGVGLQNWSAENHE